MKKLVCALLSVFLITPCMANIHIRSEAVEAVIKQKISNPDAQVAALAEYNAQIKNAGGKNAGVPAAGIWSVCTAAGWNIKTADGKSKCTDFGNTLMKYATWNFRAVCDKDKFMIERGTGRCVDNVFSNKLIGGVKVNMLIATGLAKEYARVKYNDNNLVCSKNPRKTTLPPDDYIQCISMDKNMAYEFRFDSVTATNDAEIDAGTETGVCKIFDLKYSPLDITLDTAYSKGESWPAACETTDAKICSKINESMKRFGRSAKIGTTGSKSNKHGACVIKTSGITPTTLRTAFGIDNMAFKNGGIQLNADAAVKTQVCDWVRKTVTNPTINSCVCNDGYAQMYDFSSLITETDDVLTCTINGKPVDFVFDDLSEANKKVAAGGTQGMDCMAAGGTYSGQRCINLDEAQCKLLARANIASCPTCKHVRFDPQSKSCILPSAADAEKIKKNTNIALIVGGTVVGVGVTVMTGGAGAVVVLTGIETVGAAIEMGAQLKIDAIADEFLVKSNQCKSASCAKSLIENNFQHLADSQNDFSTPEISAIDTEMARLANMIPENDDFWADMALSGLTMADNQSGVFENWTPEQWWRAVGITLQMASVVSSVGKWVGTKAKTMVTKLSKSSEVLKTKTEKVLDVVEQASSQRALTAKQLEVQQRLKVIDPSTLTGDDIEYYDLWKKYAPRNQSFDDFKRMGTIEELREMSKGWATWDEIERFSVIDAKIQRFYAEHPGALEELEQTEDLLTLQSKYPELFDLLDEFEDIENVRIARYGRYGNYSTLNPRLNFEKDKQEDISRVYQLYQEKVKQGVLDEQTAQQAQGLIMQDMKRLYLGTEYGKSNTLDEIVALRRRQIDDIINESPKLQDMREQWAVLSNKQKQDFAQEVSDQLLIRNGVEADRLPKIILENRNFGSTGMAYSTMNETTDGFVYITMTDVRIDPQQKLGFSDFMDTLAHEIGGHSVDFSNPNAGALGSQFVHENWGMNYTNANSYVMSPDEQSGFRIGNAVGAAYKSANPLPDMNSVFTKFDDVLDGTGIHVASTQDEAIKGVLEGKFALVFRNLSNDISENLSDIEKTLNKFSQDEGIYLSVCRNADGSYLIGNHGICLSIELAHM